MKERRRGIETMEVSKVVFSAPLQQLMDEHVSLRADMDLFYDITEEIALDSGCDVVELFAQLYKQVAAFEIKLKAHSRREEEGLFPLMTRHLAEDDGIIEVMEYEHEKAEQHLKEFLAEAEKAGSTIDEDDVQWITVIAVQAHATLQQHFAKEEKVLFPLAENILSDDEKKELERLFRGR
jgi:hemerythrin-like domain-containing protein